MAKKTILISGVTGNLGRAIATKFLSEGYSVFGLADSEPSATQKLTGFYKVDMSDVDAVSQMLKDLGKRIKAIDVLVSTVGGYMPGNVESVNGDNLQKMFSLNLFSTSNLVIPVFNQMLVRNSGKIFLVGAKPGLSADARAGSVAYGLSKAAIFSLAESMNSAAHKSRVVTTVIVPSTIDTPQNRKSMPASDFSKWVKPGKIASVIFNYTTDESSIIREPVVKVYGES